MRTSIWQKSSYCAEGSNCIELGAATDGGTLQIRESTAPEALLAVEPARLGAMLRAIRTQGDPTR